MQCDDFTELLPGFLDGELDLRQSIEVEKHLAGCEACMQMLEGQQVLQTAMRSGGLYHEPRPRLARNVLRAVQKKERATGLFAVLNKRRYQLAGAFAALLLLAAWGVGRMSVQTHPSDLIANEALASHVRSLMPGHLIDVVSSDKHTVKPWFNDKVDYSPPVIDLADQGFPLAGGRLDYLDSRPITALIYRRQKHVINLFLWPVTTSNVETTFQSRRGYNMIHWTRSGLDFWVVSDLNPVELHEFAQRYQEGVAFSNRL